jgi:pimeloyl-ACP methyl ester carboxylesterase
MLSFQHGTIVLDADAPSRLSATDSELLLYGAMASSGFIGVVPDYIGFGASADILHPYYVEDVTASAIIDMLFAASELAEEENISFNGRLFLAGYSEGGYATVSAHKSLEQDPQEMFELVASFAGAGAYDLQGMRSYLFDQTTYDDPYYIAYVASAYQSVYNISGTLDDFFNEPYASAIPELFDGMHSPSQINAALTTDMSLLLTSEARDGFDTDPKFGEWQQAFQQNDLPDWAPKVPLFLYHGEDDTTIPYENSLNTFVAFIGLGSTPDDVKLIALPGTHSTANGPYIQDFFPKLLALR